MRRTRPRHLIALRILCVMALVFAAFAHTAPLSAQSGDVAYALPDGTVPALCLNGGSQHPQKAAKDHCEFCRIAGSVATPTPPDTCLAEVALDSAAPPQPSAVRLARPAYFRSAPPTGPPSLFA